MSVLPIRLHTVQTKWRGFSSVITSILDSQYSLENVSGPTTLTRVLSHRLSCALIEFEPAQIFIRVKITRVSARLTGMWCQLLRTLSSGPSLIHELSWTFVLVDPTSLSSTEALNYSFPSVPPCFLFFSLSPQLPRALYFPLSSLPTQPLRRSRDLVLQAHDEIL